jgi:hypothetical protein
MEGALFLLGGTYAGGGQREPTVEIPLWRPMDLYKYNTTEEEWTVVDVQGKP